MNDINVLKDKVVLVVDDEEDILDTVSGELDMCIVHKAKDFESARQYLATYTYDVVILDIMGVNGFQLLRNAVSKGFPTIMFTAKALSPESIKRSIRLGAVYFLPKEEIMQLREVMVDVVQEEGRPIWEKVFQRLGTFFERKFGSDWKRRDEFLSEFERQLQKGL